MRRCVVSCKGKGVINSELLPGHRKAAKASAQRVHGRVWSGQKPSVQAASLFSVNRGVFDRHPAC